MDMREVDTMPKRVRLTKKKVEETLQHGGMD